MGYCRIEYAYSLMAKAAGIQMTKCQLLEEGGRAHFTTRRFGQTDDDSKLHVQTLSGLAHYDFNMPRVNSYQEAFLVMSPTPIIPKAIGQASTRCP